MSQNVEKIRGHDALLAKICGFPEFHFDYKQLNTLVQSFDLKDPANRILTCTEWLQNSVIVPELSVEVLTKLPWFEYGPLKMTLIPFTPKNTNAGTIFRMITIGNPNLEEIIDYEVQARCCHYCFTPKDWLVKSVITITPGKINAVDIRMDCITTEENPYFTMIFYKKKDYRLFNMLQVRMLVFVERAFFRVQTYQDIVDSKFLSLANQSNIHPSFAKLMVYYLMGLATKNPKKKEIQRAKDLGLIHPNAKTIHEINFNEPKWVIDYLDATEHWYFDENASNVFEGARMK